MKELHEMYYENLFNTVNNFFKKKVKNLEVKILKMKESKRCHTPLQTYIYSKFIPKLFSVNKSFCCVCTSEWHKKCPLHGFQ